MPFENLLHATQICALDELYLDIVVKFRALAEIIFLGY